MFNLALFCAIAGFFCVAGWSLGCSGGYLRFTQRGGELKLRPMLLVPLIAVLLAMSVLTSVPIQLRLWLSESALLAGAQKVRHSPDEFELGGPFYERSQRFGLFEATCQGRRNGLDVPWGEYVFFSTEPSGFIDAGGFVYSPAGRPPGEGEGVDFAHLFGPWYLWEERW